MGRAMVFPIKHLHQGFRRHQGMERSRSEAWHIIMAYHTDIQVSLHLVPEYLVVFLPVFLVLQLAPLGIHWAWQCRMVIFLTPILVGCGLWGLQHWDPILRRHHPWLLQDERLKNKKLKRRKAKSRSRSEEARREREMGWGAIVDLHHGAPLVKELIT